MFYTILFLVIGLSAVLGYFLGKRLNRDPFLWAFYGANFGPLILIPFFLRKNQLSKISQA